MGQGGNASQESNTGVEVPVPNTPAGVDDAHPTDQLLKTDLHDDDQKPSIAEVRYIWLLHSQIKRGNSEPSTNSSAENFQMDSHGRCSEIKNVD